MLALPRGCAGREMCSGDTGEPLHEPEPGPRWEAGAACVKSLESRGVEGRKGGGPTPVAPGSEQGACAVGRQRDAAGDRITGDHRSLFCVKSLLSKEEKGWGNHYSLEKF